MHAAFYEEAMKLFFISDIHGSVSSLKAALKCFEAEQADRIILLGDALYHGPRNPLPEGYAPAEVANLLNGYKERILAVRGNCDSEVDQMLIEYPMMETYSMIQMEQRKFFLTHGHVYHPDEHPALNEGDILAFGHTHLPMAEKRGLIYVFNPGSIALPKEGNPPSYGLFSEGKLQVKSFDGEVLRETAVD
jgi:putative phosphoesterase